MHAMKKACVLTGGDICFRRLKRRAVFCDPVNNGGSHVSVEIVKYGETQLVGKNRFAASMSVVGV